MGRKLPIYAQPVRGPSYNIKHTYYLDMLRVVCPAQRRTKKMWLSAGDLRKCTICTKV